MVNQGISTMCMEVERNQGTQKLKKYQPKDSIIKDVRNLFRLKKENEVIKKKKQSGILKTLLKIITNQ